jgi:hypothetical protein
MLNQHMANLNMEHWMAVRRVLRYLQGTLQMKLQFGAMESKEIFGYCDADWGGDLLKTIGSKERLLIQNLEITQGCEQCLERELQLSSILALYSLPCTTTLTNHMG